MQNLDCVVIGAGVVGLAVARKLAQDGREVVMLEQAPSIGTGISSRNSEVIHAGIYYPPGSAKARLCVAGREALYRFCQSHNVPHRRLGKLIVATQADQMETLDSIRRQAQTNGVDDLVFVSGKDAERGQPGLKCVGALHSPSTGIIDSHAFMLALQGDAEAAGLMIAFNTDVLEIRPEKQGFRVRTGGGQGFEIQTDTVVNSAGLGAPAVAKLVRGLSPRHIPQPKLAKGNYFRLATRSPFTKLIYPVPEPGGLGVHLTMDLAGQARFGPDVEWIEAEDYSVDPDRGNNFYQAVRRYWPGLGDGALQPDYCGIRPKIAGPGEPPADFVISDTRTHGLCGLINLFGIESPGLTAALAIADEISDRLRR